jgi:hypothetical protein
LLNAAFSKCHSSALLQTSFLKALISMNDPKWFSPFPRSHNRSLIPGYCLH